MQNYGRFGETPVLQEDAAPRNSLPHLQRPGYGARKTRTKALEGNADTTRRQTTHQKPPAYRRRGGGSRKGSTANKPQSPADDTISQVIGRGHKVSQAGLPIEQVLDDY